MRMGILAVGLFLITGVVLAAGGGADPSTVGTPTGLTTAAQEPTAQVETATAGALVSVIDFSFVDTASGTPVTQIAAGESVTWVWDEGVHTATSGLASGVDVGGQTFDSGTKRAADDENTFSVTFDQPGVYSYICDLHQPLMRGTIIVA